MNKNEIKNQILSIQKNHAERCKEKTSNQIRSGLLDELEKLTDHDLKPIFKRLPEEMWRQGYKMVNINLCDTCLSYAVTFQENFYPTSQLKPQDNFPLTRMQVENKKLGWYIYKDGEYRGHNYEIIDKTTNYIQ